jgi:hypothetical protein
MLSIKRIIWLFLLASANIWDNIFQKNKKHINFPHNFKLTAENSDSLVNTVIMEFSKHLKISRLNFSFYPLLGGELFKRVTFDLN